MSTNTIRTVSVALADAAYLNAIDIVVDGGQSIIV
jgi:hypothetical protein